MWEVLWTRLKIHLLFHSGVAFVYRQLWRRPPALPAGTSLAGQTAIITGANSGLGLEAARQLLGLGLGRVILAVRTPAKGEAAAAGLRTEFPEAAVDVWPLDLEDYASVQAFAARCRTLDRIDAVVLNAGVQNRARRVAAATGREQTLQVNYLSTALLALLLLPVLREARAGPGAAAKAPPTRLTVVTSTTAFFAAFAPGPVLPQFDGPYDVTQWYAREKLLLHALVARLATLVPADDVVINAVCPGLVGATDIWRDLNTSPVLRVVFGAYFALFGRSLAAGASTYVDALVGRGRESHGGHLSDWMLCPHPTQIYSEADSAFRERAWQETLQELDFAGVSRIVEDLSIRDSAWL